MGEKMKIDNVVICCENNQQLIEVLTLLEDNTDILWYSGKTPLEYENYFKYVLFDIKYLVVRRSRLTYSETSETYDHLTKISAVELFGFHSVSKSDLMDFLGASYD